MGPKKHPLVSFKLPQSSKRWHLYEPPMIPQVCIEKFKPKALFKTFRRLIQFFRKIN